MVSKKHLYRYIWFPRAIYGLMYGFQEPLMVVNPGPS